MSMGSKNTSKVFELSSVLLVFEIFTIFFDKLSKVRLLEKCLLVEKIFFITLKKLVPRTPILKGITKI